MELGGKGVMYELDWMTSHSLIPNFAKLTLHFIHPTNIFRVPSVCQTYGRDSSIIS